MQKALHFLTIICLTASLPSYALADNEQSLFELSLSELMQIKITAEKREKEWSEVPQTVDVYSGKQLRSQQVNDLRDLAETAPGFAYGRVGNISNVYLRGIGSDLISIAADASTAIYLDDVYLARPEMAVAHFWDIDHIEILKGPQGALYGRNATSGAIKIIPTRASFTKTDAYADVETGSFNERKIEAAVGGPVSESFAARASVFVIKDSGYSSDINPQGGNTIDDTDVAASRVELRWQLTPKLETSLTADYYQNNNHGYSLKPNDAKGIAQQLGAIDTPDIHQTLNNVSSFSDYKTEGINWRWDWNAEHMKLQSISAYRKIDANYLLNTDGTEIDVVESQFSTFQKQYSQELRLISNSTDNVQWLLGASWFKETPSLAVALIRHPIKTSIDIFAEAQTTAWGTYGELSWQFQPQWNLTLRFRDSNEKRNDSNKIFSTTDLLGVDSPSVNNPHPITSRREFFKKPSPQTVLSFTPDNSQGKSLWYLSATEGFKSGGANSLSTSPSFKPEDIVSYELGFKRSEKNSQWNISAFRYNYKDLQVVTFENGVTAINNAATAAINGIDAAALLNVGDSMQYQIGMTWLDAHYKTFISSLAGKAIDVSGNVMPYAPAWDFNQKISYRLTTTIGDVDFQLLHHFQSKTYFSQFEDAAVAVNARNIFDAVGNIEINHQWSVSAGIYNLTNKNYFQNIVRFTTTSIASAPEGNALGYPALGRHWMIGINVQL